MASSSSPASLSLSTSSPLPPSPSSTPPLPPDTSPLTHAWQRYDPLNNGTIPLTSVVPFLRTLERCVSGCNFTLLPEGCEAVVAVQEKNAPGLDMEFDDVARLYNILVGAQLEEKVAAFGKAGKEGEDTARKVEGNVQKEEYHMGSEEGEVSREDGEVGDAGTSE